MNTFPVEVKKIIYNKKYLLQNNIITHQWVYKGMYSMRTVGTACNDDSIKFEKIKKNNKNWSFWKWKIEKWSIKKWKVKNLKITRRNWKNEKTH